MDKFKSRLAKRWSILILTRPVVKTGYNLITGRLGQLFTGIQMYRYAIVVL